MSQLFSSFRRGFTVTIGSVYLKLIARGTFLLIIYKNHVFMLQELDRFLIIYPTKSSIDDADRYNLISTEFFVAYVTSCSLNCCSQCSRHSSIGRISFYLPRSANFWFID